MILPNRPSCQYLMIWVGPGKKGNSDEQRGEHLGMGAQLGEDLLVGSQVDPERLLSQQVLAGADDVAINLRMQMVWHGAVDRVHAGVGEQLAIVGDRGGDVTQVVGEPIQAGRLGVGDGHQFRADVHIQQMAPALRRTGELARHQPASDDAEADCGRSHARFTPGAGP